MKNIITLGLISLSIISKAQEVSVEKSVLEIQTGFLGIWIHKESKLTNTVTLRSELGLDGEFSRRLFYDYDNRNVYIKTLFLMTPVLTVEPRYYYNLIKRNLKSKDITNNSGNFISLKTSYQPDWFVISRYENTDINSSISVIPTWGIRRNIGKHFNYETGIGLGYRYFFVEDAGHHSIKSEEALNLHLRIGYTF